MVAAPLPLLPLLPLRRCCPPRGGGGTPKEEDDDEAAAAKLILPPAAAAAAAAAGRAPPAGAVPLGPLYGGGSRGAAGESNESMASSDESRSGGPSTPKSLQLSAPSLAATDGAAAEPPCSCCWQWEAETAAEGAIRCRCSLDAPLWRRTPPAPEPAGDAGYGRRRGEGLAGAVVEEEEVVAAAAAVGAGGRSSQAEASSGAPPFPAWGPPAGRCWAPTAVPLGWGARWCMVGGAEE